MKLIWALPAAGLSVHKPAGISHGRPQPITRPVSTATPNANLQICPVGTTYL